MNCRLTLPFLILMFLSAAPAFGAQTIGGVVQNKTTGARSAEDEVLLLGLGQGMQEQDRTKTNAQGEFTLHATSSNEEYVVRVIHQGVNYDQVVISTGPIEIAVYDAVPKVPGLSGDIGMAQVESDGTTLKITEMYAITNASNPPVTQSRPDNYEISLPDKAAFESVEVRSGKGMWVKVAPEPLKGKSGKYGINFPMRPGDTLFKFVYHLPYQGPTTFHLELPYPIARFGVMHPPSMSFKALRQGTFTSPGIASGLRVEQAVARPVVGDVPAFEISGIGTAPQHGTDARATPPPALAIPNSGARSANVQPLPNQSTDGSRALALAIVITAAAALLLWGIWTWRRKHQPVPMLANPGPQSSLDSLKEELFRLESDRLHGAITADDYATTKQALDAVIQRALARK